MVFLPQTAVASKSRGVTARAVQAPVISVQSAAQADHGEICSVTTPARQSWLQATASGWSLPFVFIFQPQAEPGVSETLGLFVCPFPEATAMWER